MRRSDLNGDYVVPEHDEREIAPGVDAAISYDDSSRDPYAEAELKLRSERTEAMIRRAEGYATAG